MNSVKINFIKGSIFQTERFKLDAISVFIPAGLTAIRVNCIKFIKQFEKPLEKHGEFSLFKTNYKKDTHNSLKYVIIDFNKSHNTYNSFNFSPIIAHVLGEFSKLGVKRIGMNGIKTSGGMSEFLTVSEVKAWLKRNNHNFEEIYFIDLRDGFNKNI